MIRPSKSIWLQRGFRVYNRHLLRRTFHRIHLDGDPAALRGDRRTPLLLCVSHSSWWDLLLGLALDDLMPEWDSYAAMDEAQLKRYRFFSRLGVIGVNRSSLQGAREFVSYSHELLEGRPTALWITPQGEFTSNAQRPARFQPGIGAIAGKLSAFHVSTIVLDYEFWSESRPEAFISVRPLERIVTGPDFDRRAFVRSMERKMERHLDELTALRLRRDPHLFSTMLAGTGTVSPLYDSLRALSARIHGEPFVPAHGDIVTPPWRSHEHRKP